MIFFENRAFHLCDLFGVPIDLDISFAIILLLFCLDAPLGYGLAFALVLALSIVLHELGHSRMAAAFGYRTSRITLSLLGGCASLVALPRKPWQEFLTAVAGPLVSFVLGAVAWTLLGMDFVGSGWLANILYYTAILNITLALFNLLPALPMDGGRIFRAGMCLFFSRLKATYLAMIVGRVAAVLLVVLPLVGIRHLGPIPIGGYFFIRLLIAWMIWTEGKREFLLEKAASRFTSWSQDDFQARVSPPPYDD